MIATVRAMLCTMWSMLSQDVCPSACLSHAGILSKWLNFFHCWIATRFQFSHTKWYGNILTRTTLMGASNAGGYEKNCNFRPISRFISEMIQDRAIVAMKDE